MSSSAFAITPPYTPELLLVVQHVIKNILIDGGDVFEYGSGYSTLWFAQFANVVTVEHNIDWYAELIKALEESDLKVEHHLVIDSDMPCVIDSYELFDLILIDCLDSQRVEAVHASMSHVKPNGWLLLDDSHWPHLAQARKLLSAWPCTIVKGPHRRHIGVQRDHQTSLYQRLG